MKFLLLITSLFFVGSCMQGPKTEKKSKLNYLSGEHFKATDSLNIIPTVVTRREVPSTISGYLLYKTANIPLPLGNKDITLINNKGEVLSKSKTLSDGSFIIKHVLNNGTYTLQISDESYKMKQKISLSGYELKNLNLIAIKSN